MTGDEKWVVYCNVKPVRLCVTLLIRQNPKKMLLIVWQDMQGIIHWEVLSFYQTINAAFYCLLVDRLLSDFAAKR